MPRRRRFKKRRTKRRSRRRRKTKISRWGVSKYNVHQYRRYARVDSLSLGSNVPGEATKGFSFSVDQVTQWTEFGALYDQYKINYITLKLMWSPKTSLSVDPNNPGQSIYPVLYYYNDYDDDAAPSSLANIRERSNLRTVRISPNRTINIIVKPAISMMMYRSATTTGYGPKWNQKIDVATPDVPHYGLKMCVSYLPNQPCGALSIETIYHMTLYGVK